MRMKRAWLHSASFQPMNGQPVWAYHDGSKDIYGQQHEAGVYKSVFNWDNNVEAHYPFWWRIRSMEALYGNRLWQPRLDGEMPDPPPVPFLPDIKPILAHERPLL